MEGLGSKKKLLTSTVFRFILCISKFIELFYYCAEFRNRRALEKGIFMKGWTLRAPLIAHKPLLLLLQQILKKCSRDRVKLKKLSSECVIKRYCECLCNKHIIYIRNGLYPIGVQYFLRLIMTISLSNFRATLH